MALGDGTHTVVFHVARSKTARMIETVSIASAEEEVIGLLGTRYKVSNVEEVLGQGRVGTHIYMMEV